ncbi:MAG: biotin/lipoyl-binding protein [Anaerolineales bacterium]|nr:biotin/lipoyl-binding protein [Anaerolineales bacterium]
MHLRLSRFLIVLTAVLLLSGCALRSVTGPRTVDPAGEPTPVPTAVSIESSRYTVQVGDIVREVSLEGLIVPVTQIELSFAQAGEVAAIHVVSGQEVVAGDILAELDTTAIENELVLAQATLTVAQEQLAAAATALANDQRRAEIDVEKARLTLENLRFNAAEPPTPNQAYQIQLAELDLELAELALSELEVGVDQELTAAVTEQQLQIDGLNGQLASAQLIAPASGTVLRINARGEQAISPDEVAIILADLDNLELRLLAGEADLALMMEGMTGTAQLTNQPGPTVPATLTTLPIEYGGTGEEGNIVRFTLADEGVFVSNDRLTVTLIVGERTNVVWLPPQAIREFRGRQFVVVEEGDGQRRVDIEVGLANRQRVEIIAGLEPGQIVIGE